MKVCKVCNEEKSEDQFYSVVKKGQVYFLSYCKKCSNTKRVEMRKLRTREKGIQYRCGWDKLTEETRNDIIAMLKNGEKRAIIAEKHNIPYNKLGVWIHRKKLKD